MKLLTYFLIFTWATFFSAQAAESPAELVVRWSFEDNLEDSSGNEYFGKKSTPKNEDGVLEFAEGKFGRAVHLDEKTAIIGPIMDKVVHGKNDPWTINVWVKSVVCPGWAHLGGFADKGEVSGSQRIIANFGGLSFYAHNSVLSARNCRIGSDWTMYSVVSTGEEILLYLNAVAVKAGVPHSNPGVDQVDFEGLSDTKAPFAFVGDRFQAWPGFFDEFTIWNNALTKEQLTNLMTTNKPD